MSTKLNKDHIEDIISLTSMQEGMLFHYMMDSEGLAYHEQVSIDLEGDIEPDLLQQAWDLVIQSNEMLRAVYRWRGIDKPVQVILRNHQVRMQCYDFSEQDNIEQCLAEVKQLDLQNRIDIEQETLRIALCKRGTNQYTMIISNHHIQYDGWSNAVMVNELMRTYKALYRGREPTTIVKSKFGEHVKWLESLDKSEQKSYWETYLAGAQPNDSLFSRGDQCAMEDYQVVLSKEIGDKMKEFVKENEISAAAFLYSVWGLLVQKLNCTRDIIFGATISGRNHHLQGIEQMIGLFINTIPLRIRTDPQETVASLLQKVNQMIKEQSQFESTPLVDVAKYAKIENKAPLFNSLVVIENYPLSEEHINDDTLTIKDYSAIGRTNYNLTLGITIQDGITLDFGYNCFTCQEIIIKIGHAFERILLTMLANKEMKVANIELLTKAERDQVLNQFNDTYADYPRDKTIQQLFEEQVEKTPDQVALVFNDTKMSYRELNQLANQVARNLRRRGVKADTIVGIVMDRSSLMIIGILGVLKAGGAYLPIDPDYPEERFDFMLADSGSKILLTESQLGDPIKFDGEKIDLTTSIFTEESTENLDRVNRPDDLAYVIYTSGSTGKPKGVMVEQRQVVNLALGQIKRFKLGEHERILQFYSIGFDPSVEQIFVALLSGSALYLVAKEILLSSREANGFIRRHAITHLDATPSFLEMLNFEELSSLKRVMSSAEACSVKLAKALSEKLAFYNSYGPTEATVTAIMHLVNPAKIGANIPIGKPITNYQAYILNNDRNLLPIGIPGELYIGGEGLARAYLNRPELTKEKFVENPFIANERLYRTGDWARWLPNGDIEFLGRIDHQLKIRGFRIELGEIEATLLKHPHLSEAVVICRENQLGKPYLCAYFVAKQPIEISELREYLAQELPDYMIPAQFIPLAKMPLTPNKKIDRQKLPQAELTRADDTTTYAPPETEAEKLIAQIWQDILAIDKVGLEDNFFDLGGNSLDIMKLSARLEKEFKQEIPVVMLFKYTTINLIINYLSEGGHVGTFKDRGSHVQSRKDKLRKLSERKRR